MYSGPAPITAPSSDGTILHDLGVGIDIDQDQKKLVIATSQDIPDDYVSELKAQKIDPDHKPIGDMLHFARIPTVFIEQMMKDGVDFNRATVREICEWLKKRHLDAFIVTSKRLY